MEFIKFQKVKYGIQEYEFNKNNKNLQLSLKNDFYITEKIHGSNFSIYCDGNNIKCAKRTGFLTDDNWFYGWKIIKDLMKNSIYNLFKYISKNYDVKGVVLYGELFGGYYGSCNGDIIERVNKLNKCYKDGSNFSILIEDNLRPIQEGVYYSKEIKYKVFDILILLSNGDKVFLNYNKMANLCSKFNIDYCKILFEGKINECITWDINFNSLVAKEINKENTLDDSNIAEGIVIRSCLNLVIENNERLIIKVKHPYFSEMNNCAFNVGDTSNICGKNAINIVLGMTNYNRIESIISKLGIRFGDNINDNLYMKLIDLIWYDMMSDYYQYWNKIVINDENQIRNEYEKKIKTLINGLFIIDI